jgi:hypothetical protein
MNEEEKTFVDSARRVLDESLVDMDGATVSRLARDRQRALLRHTREKRLLCRKGIRFVRADELLNSALNRPLFLLGSVSSLAVAILLVVLVMPSIFGQARTEIGMVADLSIITSEEPIDLFEDIEFYEWISALDVEVPAPGAPDVPPDPFHDGTGAMPESGAEGRGA